VVLFFKAMTPAALASNPSIRCLPFFHFPLSTGDGCWMEACYLGHAFDPAIAQQFGE
jgi:hypothetical protein